MPKPINNTLVITNFGGPLTRRNTGNIDSGLAKFDTSWGYDPYSKPGNLTWMEQPTSILTFPVSQIGPMMAMKQRSEGSRNDIYGFSVGDRFYDIQVASSTNPDVDAILSNTSIIAANYDFGAGLAFYGSPEKVFISTDTSIIKSSFNGTAQSTIGTFSASVPRPMTTFLGKVYFGNGNNIGEIDSTEVITDTSRLDPALPSGLFVRDLDVTPDGNYLQIIASRTNASAPYGASQDTYSPSGADSYKFYWNGIDDSYSASESYSGLVLSANVAQSDKDYTFGYDVNGAGIFEGSKKVMSLPQTISPTPNATFSVGNLLGFGTAEQDNSDNRFRATIYHYGQYDEEIQKGLYRLLRQDASTGNEMLAVSAALNVSNRVYAPSVFGGVPNNIVGIGKVYFSTNEGDTDVANTVQKLWRFHTTPISTQSILAGVYETQTQLFSKKVAIKEVRLYTEPLVNGNDFIVDLIGSGGSVMSGGSQRFIVGTSSIVAGTDMVLFNPAMAPTYALGARITNSSITGVVNWTALKMEVDIAEGGK